jgi:hypothetical protein
VAEQKSITLRPASAAEILPYIEQAARFNSTTEKGIASRIAKTDYAFVIEVDGMQQFGFTLAVENGTECFITSAAGRSKLDLVEVGLKVIEGQARGLNLQSVGFRTCRKGLVKKAQKHGYEVAAYIMRKKLK